MVQLRLLAWVVLPSRNAAEPSAFTAGPCRQDARACLMAGIMMKMKVKVKKHGNSCWISVFI